MTGAITCPHCDAPLSRDVQFCPNCGAPAPQPRPAESTQPLHTRSPAPDDDVPDWAREAEDLPTADQEDSGLRLDWESELRSMVEEAAELEGLTVDRFIRALVEPAARKVLRSKKGVVTLNQAADMLGISRKEVIQMISSGRLRARKVENEWKVEKDSIDQDAKATASREDQIELDLRQIVESSGLMGLEAEGKISNTVSATVCYVNQEGMLVCPRAAWRKLGRDKLLAEAKDAVRRYLRRRDRELGRL